MARATERFEFPHLMMGYYNTVFRLTHGTFCERLSAAGGAGFIVPDLPIEEYHDLFPLSETHPADAPSPLFTPTNSDARLPRSAATAAVSSTAWPGAGSPANPPI